MGIINAILPNLDALVYMFNALAGFNAVIIVFLFVRYYRSYSPATPFLMVFLLGMLMVNLMTFLIKTGHILYVPWLFRLPTPLYYAMFPAAYLYLLMTLRDQPRLKKAEWLHFLPAVLHAIEYAPYNLRSNAYKVQHILETMKNPLGTYAHDEGVLPAYIHNTLRGVQGLVYGLMMFYLLVADLKSDKGRVNLFSGMKSWLFRLSGVVILFSLSIFSTFIGGWATPDNRAINLAFWSAFTLSVCSFTLFYNPLLLYGMPLLNRFLQKPLKEETPSAAAPSPIETNLILDSTSPEGQPEWLDRYTSLVEQYKLQGKSFLSPKFCIRDLSVELGIPQHHLSYVLNKVYHVRFNDFVNNLRIDYLRRKMEGEDLLRQMTLEGLAREAGFTSRVTFIRAVQRTTGMNPSSYFRHLPAE